MMVIAVVLGLVAAPTPALAQSCSDCDRDGFTVEAGDCDDTDKAARPFGKEVCGDRIDNNCDGFFNEGCDQTIHLGTLRGGGGCTRSDGTYDPASGSRNFAWVFLLPLFGLGRRLFAAQTGAGADDP